MACEEFENRLPEYLENQLSPAERLAVETHLAGCARCQAFARQLQQLDAALTRAIKSPILPSDFSARLRQRIQTEGALLSEAQCAERKRRLQAEFEAGLAQLRRKWLASVSLPDVLGCAALATFAGGVILEFAPTWANLAAQHGLDRADLNLVLAWIISAVCLLIGLTVAFPRPLKQLWMAL